MGSCELTGTCPFFNGKMDHSPAIVEEMKEKYCLKNNLNCSIYLISTSLGPEKIPSDLLPNEKERFYLFLAENG